MQRRSFLAAALALAGWAPLAQALELRAFDAAAFARAQADGAPAVLHFHADWCPTCREQAQVLEQLRAQGGLNLTVWRVDYDNAQDLRRALKVRMQSTLIAYKGRTETGRLAGDTQPAALRKLLESAL